MTKRTAGRAAAAAAALLVTCIPATAGPGSGLVFGPKTYTIDGSRPQVERDEFPIDASAFCEGRAAFVLVVEDADVNGANRISSGEIVVNGVRLVSESDFPLHKPVERAFMPAAVENSLDVTLTGGRPGSSIIVSIRREIEERIVPPSDYLLAQNGPNAFSQQFDGPDSTSPYILVVENGDSDGGRRVTRGSLTLNGAVVVTNADLHDAVTLVRRRITLQARNELRIEAVGRQQDLLRVSIKRLLPETACALLSVSFTTPADGAVIDTSRIMVTGTVTGTRDLGVTVNGSVADVDLSRAGSESDPFTWRALVTADSGVVGLKAVVTDGRRATATAARTVQYAPSAEWVMLRPSTRSGPAPLDVTFSVTLRVADAVVQYEFDFDGDGAFELSAPQLPDDMTHSYRTVGPHTPTMRARLSDGRVLTDRVPVLVQPFSVINELLQAEWSAFVTALAGRDVAAAVSRFGDEETRAKYLEGLERIRPTLPEFTAAIKTIEPIWITGDAAHYLLTRNEDGSPRGYHVYFVRDAAGVWRIAQF